MDHSTARRQFCVRFLALLLAASFLPPATLLHAHQPSKKQKMLIAQESGFLGDEYAKLRPDPGDPDWLIYFRDPGVLRQSNTFLLDKVQVYLIPQSQRHDVSQDDLDKLADHFTQAVEQQLVDGRYQLVDQPGPGVLRLRFAITNVQPNDGKTNMAVAGSAAVAGGVLLPVPGASELLPRLKVGKVSIEGEMLDSQSGQVEMAFMTAKSGRRFFSGLRAFKKWADIDAAFRDWAKNFRKRLDRAHAG